MSVSVQRSIASVAVLTLCLVVYAVGVYLTRAFLCQPVGAWVLLGGVAIGAVGWLLLSMAAISRRSIGLGVGVVGVAALLAAMYFFIGVLTLPGCSGV